MDLDLEEMQDLRAEIETRAGEERKLQRFKGGYLAELDVEFRGRKSTVTFAVHGHWEHVIIEAIGY